MPYPTIADLPAPVRHTLPAHAQEIYRAAFNNAWARDALRGDEATLHRIAWAAVKRGYEKRDGVWMPRRLHDA